MAAPVRRKRHHRESVIPLSGRTLGVLNDNNYPFNAGCKPGQPDDNAFILLRLGEALPIDPDVGPEDDEDEGDQGSYGQR